MSISNADLRPYGFIPAIYTEGWCATCGRTVEGLSPKAFKCRPCAVEQFRLVEKQIETCGEQVPSNPVPPAFRDLRDEIIEAWRVGEMQAPAA